MAGRKLRGSAFIPQRRWGLVLSAVMALSFPATLWGRSWVNRRILLGDVQIALAPSRARDAGDAACAECHPSETSSQARAPMARALVSPGDSEVLLQHPQLTFRQGPYVYQIQRDKNGDVRFTVSDATRTITVPILWAFGYGLGEVGQTYVIKRGGQFWESRVSYFDSIQGLDVTIGHDPAPPASLELALGRALSDRSTRKCFGCHATAAVKGDSLQLNKMIPGITCENCHGPGLKHIEAVRAGRFNALRIFNPGRLSTGRLTDFCAPCHQKNISTTLARTFSLNTVRFQGYRLARSRCYDPRDPRISCLACHNPHQDVERGAAFYDAKCLACHSLPGPKAPDNAAGAAGTCVVAKTKCVACHMPRVEIPQSHHEFTDHWVRVAKPGDAYPD